MNVELGEVELLNEPVPPLTIDQAPVPTEGTFADNVAVFPSQMVWVVPAFDVVGGV